MRCKCNLLIGMASSAMLLALGMGSAAHARAIEVYKAPVAKTSGYPEIKANVDVSQHMLQHPSNDNWLLHGRTYSNDRFSPLKQIDAGNVKTLTPVAIAQTGFTASFETTPIVVNGVMYVSTPMVNSKQAVIAMDATTGRTLWKFTHDTGTHQICCGPENRGVAVAYGKAYFLTVDNDLIALNAKTGKKLWSTSVANAQAGYSETMAPQVYDHKVFVGSAGGEWPLRGFIAAYNADNGKQVWRFNTTDSHGTWSGKSWKTGGGTVWTTPAIDAKDGLIIFSTGNPNPDLNGKSRKGKNLYTDSLIALHLNNGKMAWYYQELPHDVWDYDAVSNVLLFDAKENGHTVPAVGEAGKVGWFFIVNRKTGHLIRKSQPFVKMWHMFSKPTKKGVKTLPGANGGSEWSPPAYSPMTHDVYVLGLNQLMTYTTKGAKTIPGTMRLGSTFKNVKGGLQDGTFTAINVNTGKIDWQKTVPQPMVGGALATAGNLAFVGEGDGYFDAYNATTGKRLWRFYLGAGVNAPPIAYKVNGREYIAVAAGGNFQIGYPRGDLVAIFALPKT